MTAAKKPRPKSVIPFHRHTSRDLNPNSKFAVEKPAYEQTIRFTKNKSRLHSPETVRCHSALAPSQVHINFKTQTGHSLFDESAEHNVESGYLDPNYHLTFNRPATGFVTLNKQLSRKDQTYNSTQSSASLNDVVKHIPTYNFQKGTGRDLQMYLQHDRAKNILRDNIKFV